MRTVHDPSATPHTQKRNRTVLWTGVITVGVAVFVLALGTIDGADGEPLLSGKLVEVTLLQVGAVSVIVWPMLLRTSKDIAGVKDNVQNSHSTVMRDDMDEKHDQIVGLVKDLHDNIETRFEGVSSDFRGVRKDLGRHSDQLIDQGKEIAKIGQHQNATDRKLDKLAETREEDDESHP
ncbi:hypothetical protein [Pseudoclavibacter sp. RFBG4]|uniref:hypothetical protein n=1 Tax=Pseudoclavibacter sp. RFBG4 TaxID=2080575 RepID=UPI0015E4039A|nr:hypothetical protein [Pseudoclavibacter sp. RFBG4]